MTSSSPPALKPSMDEEKITLPSPKMRARAASLQSNVAYPFANKRAKLTEPHQEVKEQDWPLGEKSFGETPSKEGLGLTGTSTSSTSVKSKGFPAGSKAGGSSSQDEVQAWSSADSKQKGVAVGLTSKVTSKVTATSSNKDKSTSKDSELLLSVSGGMQAPAPGKAPSTPPAKPKAETTDTPGDEKGEEAGKSTSFPERLMELFEGDVAEDAMWWLPGGDAFALSPDLFPDQVLQKYFQGTKFESFTRKLNRWGFKRLAGQRVPTNCVAYYHNLFQKGKPELLKEMRSGKKKDADLQDALLQIQLRRDLEAVGLANAYGSHGSIATSSHSQPQPQSQPSHNFAYGGGLGGSLPGLSGLDNESLLRSLLQQQQGQGQGNPFAQEIQSQTLLGRNYSADIVVQRQAQLLAAAEKLMRTQRLQQQQQQEHQRQQEEQQQQQHATLVSELQQRLLGGGGFGSSLNSFSDLSPMLLAAQQGQAARSPRFPSSLPSSFGSPPPPPPGGGGQLDSRLIQLLLLQEQQKRQEQDRRLP